MTPIAKLRTALAATTALFLGACTLDFSPTRENGPAGAAWVAWKAGEFASANTIAQELVSDPQTSDAALAVLAAVAHITGDYEDTIAYFDRIDPKARGDVILLEAVFESLLHLGRAPEAYAMVKEAVSQSPEYLLYYIRAKVMAQNPPLRVEIDRTFELEFIESEIYLPGVNATLNGVETTVRLDTGGAFIHMSPSQAERFGVNATDCAEGFASLQMGDFCMGIAEQLTIGDARLYNVPVAVMEVMENSQLSKIDDSPILGTNIFQQFLVTIDAPEQRLIVSERNNPQASEEHFARIKGTGNEVPFVMWGDHFMIARGSMTARNNANFFIDSGLAFGTPELGWAAIMVPKSTGEKWKKLGKFDSFGMSQVPDSLSLGPLSQNDIMAMVVPNKTWQPKTEGMGGVRIDALLSYGFLKNYAWTIDFDRRVYVFTQKE